MPRKSRNLNTWSSQQCVCVSVKLDYKLTAVLLARSAATDEVTCTSLLATAAAAMTG